MALRTQAGQERRARNKGLRERAAASRAPARLAEAPADASATVWRRDRLPGAPHASMGVPLSEGVTSVFLGAVLYVPVALVTGFSPWNYLVAAVLVVALSYALVSRKVLVGRSYVAVRKFGPYRVASAEALTSGALTPSLSQNDRRGVLKLRTGDGRTMRLRRVEYTQPDVSAALRGFLLSTGRPYDEAVMLQLALPWRADFGHHRYLLDAVS